MNDWMKWSIYYQWQSCQEVARVDDKHTLSSLWLGLGSTSTVVKVKEILQYSLNVNKHFPSEVIVNFFSVLNQILIYS